LVAEPGMVPDTCPGLMASSRSGTLLIHPTRRSQDGDAVGIRPQFQVVADVHRLNQEAKLFGQLFAHALDAPHEFAALIAVDKGIKR